MTHDAGKLAAGVVGWVATIACLSQAAGCGPQMPARKLSLQQRSVGAWLTEMLPVGSTHQTKALLDDNLSKDRYQCLPDVDTVFAVPRQPLAVRRINGQMPHYDFYDGPMHYRVWAEHEKWRVALTMAFELPKLGAGGRFELAGCELNQSVDAPIEGMRCEGVADVDAPGLHACPDGSEFDAPATRDNLMALMRLWSSEVERDYNRDAAFFSIPVSYDIEMQLVDEPAKGVVDVRIPLTLSCGRTPYFSAFRTGWSLPIVAHEVGHFLGLLDEYEALSGALYPKTPFVGSQNSRMGVSMKTATRFLPLHHYLILRRYHCPRPTRQQVNVYP